jgi:hypothetical protein
MFNHFYFTDIGSLGYVFIYAPTTKCEKEAA